MSTLQEIEARARTLPLDQRAQLAASLLDSLPAFLEDEDGGLAEARRRDAEMDTDPSARRSEEEFRKAVFAARKR